MGILKTKGIIIAENNMSDYDKMVTILTPNGKIGCAAKGARRPKSSLMAATQFLCFGDYMIYEGASSYNLNSCEVIEVFYNLRTDLDKLNAAVYITKTKECIFTSSQINEENYVSNIEVGKAVRASSSFPIIYEPMKYGEKLLLDGGVLDNVPVKAVKKLGAEKVISVNFDSDKIDLESNAIDIIMKVSDIMGRQISEEDLKLSDYIITVPTDGTGILDVSKIDYCYESGYEIAKEQIKNMSF